MSETTSYDPSYDDDDVAGELLESVGDMISREGPVVAERITCIHCGHVEIAIHAFAESIECGGCRKRNVSIVPRYPELHGLDGPL